MTPKSFSLLKRKYIFILFIFSFATIEKTIAQNPERFFNKKDIMTIGSYYYPEHWPKKYWANDLKTMADVGFEFTHFGEFAWTFIEPEEGKFDFSWLDDAVELATKTELKSSCALHRQHHLH